MPSLTPVTSHRSSDPHHNSRSRLPNHKEGSGSMTFKRPPTPELVQDLSVRRRGSSSSSESSDIMGRHLTSPPLSGSPLTTPRHQPSPDKPLDLTAHTGTAMNFSVPFCRAPFNLVKICGFSMVIPHIVYIFIATDL